jgi:hypothetical protein
MLHHAVRHPRALGRAHAPLYVRPRLTRSLPGRTASGTGHVTVRPPPGRAASRAGPAGARARPELARAARRGDRCSGGSTRLHWHLHDDHDGGNLRPRQRAKPTRTQAPGPGPPLPRARPGPGLGPPAARAGPVQSHGHGPSPPRFSLTVTGSLRVTRSRQCHGAAVHRRPAAGPGAGFEFQV